MFLNDYCASATPTTDLVTMPTTCTTATTPTQPCPTITTTNKIVTITTNLGPTVCPGDEASISQTDAPVQSRPTSTRITTSTATVTVSRTYTATTPLAVLGALLGLSVVLLAVVITGWVWTCWTMKKREGGKKSPVQDRLGN